jgi:hypothetical protein
LHKVLADGKTRATFVICSLPDLHVTVSKTPLFHDPKSRFHKALFNPEEANTLFENAIHWYAIKSL